MLRISPFLCVMRRSRVVAKPCARQASTPPSSAATRHLTIDEVQAHVGDPFAVRHMKFAALLLHGRLSCVDGRDDSGVVGTPGGDTGEFLLALSALERVTGKALGDVEVGKLLRRRLDTFGRFYLHTDIHAGNALISRLRNDRRFDGPLQNVFHTHEWRRFLRNPPKELRPLLLDILMENPHHLGCGHVRLSLQNADEYGSRALLIESFLRLFFNTLWQGDVSADYVALGGGHREGAVVNVVVDDDVHSFTDIPLVSPSLGGQQMFVNHPQVASFLRRELAAFLVQQRDIVSLPPGGEAALIAEIDALAARQLTSTLSRLAKGLPIYTATFGKEAVRVDDNGFV
jgi:hypothetical protein